MRTTTSLIDFTFFEKAMVGSGYQTNAFFVDFGKAFDRLSYSVLKVKKLGQLCHSIVHIEQIMVKYFNPQKQKKLQ